MDIYAEIKQPREQSPEDYPEWRRFDQFDGEGNERLKKVNELIYTNPAGERKQKVRPIVKDTDRRLWIGNPVETDQDLFSRHWRLAQYAVDEGICDAEDINGYFENHQRENYQRDLELRNRTEQVQYLAWRLAELLPLKHYRVPEVKAGMFDGKRYVWTEYEENVVRGGTVKDHLFFADYSDEARAERNVLYAILRKSDANIANDLLVAGDEGEPHYLGIDFEFATSEFNPFDLLLTPFDSVKLYRDTCGRLAKPLTGNWRQTVSSIQSAVRDSGFADIRAKEQKELAHLLGFQQLVLETLEQKKQKYKELIKYGLGPAFAAFAYDDAVRYLQPDLPLIFEGHEDVYKELANKVDECGKQMTKEEIQKWAIKRQVEAGILEKNKDGELILKIFNIPLEELWLNLCRCTHPREIAGGKN